MLRTWSSPAPWRARVKIDPRLLTLLPQPVVNAHKVLPVAFCNNRLTCRTRRSASTS